MEYKGFDKNFALTGKVALITGAAQGIGLAIAELFAEKGTQLILCDLSDKVEAIAADFTAGGTKAIALKGDLTVTETVTRIVQDSIAAFGRIDILINSAGVVFLDNAENLSESNWDKTMAVNLKAPFIISQLVGREMIKANSGKIINLASQAGFIALDKHVAYCTSKAGIIEMTKVLAMEWAGYNITVNDISQNVVLTELGKKAWAGEVGEAFKKQIPVGRFAYPEEIAACALFLASDAAAMITGENLVIDGGFTIQ
jgi:NAD(P)-dependent dehydrogenase (short-subunit alcohol dehydrogenase family)